MRYFYLLFLLLNVLKSLAQLFPQDEQVIKEINDIAVVPQYITFTNEQQLLNDGGHIQGVQFYTSGADQYLFMSGSSSEYSYLAILDLKDGSVLNVFPLSDKPLKHAGGFQIFENTLAVGIEDNDLRNYSEICFYLLSDPKKFKADPLCRIKRFGEYERATAGCVAMTRFLSKWVVLVGDWNTRHLDFYVSKNRNQAEGFELVQEMTLTEQDKSSWIDTTWLPYQNINLWSVDGMLYLGGMTTTDGANILDIYRVNHDDLTNFQLVKMTSKELEALGANFIWGGGMHFEDHHVKSVIATPRNLQEVNPVFFYPIKR